MADRTGALMSSTQSRRFRATTDFALMARLSEVARMTETGTEQKPPVLVSPFTVEEMLHVNRADKINPSESPT